MTDRNLELRQMPITCDFCARPGQPTWRYDLPSKTPVMVTLDRQTGVVEKTLSHGGMGACDDCDSILQSRVKTTIPIRLARRMVKHEMFESLTDEQRARSRAGWAKNLKRIVPLLTNRRPNTEQEADPMDGLGLFYEKDLDGTA